MSNLKENFDITNSDGSLSPTSLRRSTRVCALNAQKKIKGEEIMVDIQVIKFLFNIKFKNFKKKVN